MLVTEVKKITDRKCRIRLEDGGSFVLYLAEVRKYRIQPQEDLPEETIRQITEEVLKKRACLRCLNLLKTSDRTVQQLTGRLRLDGYPEEVIRSALDYVASYHYTDDSRYAQNYVRMMSARKSRRQIEAELLGKGVDHEVVRAALCEADAEASDAGGLEKEAILALARKRGYDPATAGRDETARFYRYLTGKGFGYETIRSVLSAGISQ